MTKDRARAAWLLLGVAVMALVLGLTWTVVQTTLGVRLIRETQLDNAQRAKETQLNTETIERLAEDIESCTTPEGECAKRNARATADAIATINEITIFAAACATQGNDTATEIRLCVENQLAMRSGNTEPDPAVRP